MITIKELTKDNTDEFFEYLAEHLAENGSFVFLPLSKSQSKVTKELKERFISGLSKSNKETGWRKLWVAKNQSNTIIGHIDIRSYNSDNSKHRVLLGMGVDKNHRGIKIGERLVDFVITYCKNQPEIFWLDLDVITSNLPAVNLYKKMNFKVLSNTIDMFRIDGISYDHTSMTLNVES